MILEDKKEESQSEEESTTRRPFELGWSEEKVILTKPTIIMRSKLSEEVHILLLENNDA